MKHDDIKQKTMFTSAGARLGLVSYVILIMVVAFIFMAG